MTPFFSISSFAASSFACMTPAAFVAASRSSLAAFSSCSSLMPLFLIVVAFFGSRLELGP